MIGASTVACVLVAVERGIASQKRDPGISAKNFDDTLRDSDRKSNRVKENGDADEYSTERPAEEAETPPDIERIAVLEVAATLQGDWERLLQPADRDVAGTASIQKDVHNRPVFQDATGTLAQERLRSLHHPILSSNPQQQATVGGVNTEPLFIHASGSPLPTDDVRPHRNSGLTVEQMRAPAIDPDPSVSDEGGASGAMMARGHHLRPVEDAAGPQFSESRAVPKQVSSETELPNPVSIDAAPTRFEASTARLSPPPDIGLQISEALIGLDVRKVGSMGGSTIRSLRVVLKPDTAGTVEITLLMREDRLHVRLSASQEETAASLQHDSRRLERLIGQVTGLGQAAIVTVSNDEQQTIFDVGTGSPYPVSIGEPGAGSRDSSSRGQPPLPDKDEGPRRSPARTSQHEIDISVERGRTGTIVV